MEDKVTDHIINNIYKFNDQYFYGSLVNTYLIELETKLLLFDLPTYSKEIEDHLKSFNKPIEVLLSHGSCGISDGTKWQERLNIRVYLHEADKNYEWLRMKPDILFTTPPIFDDSLEVILTPGHSAGSICLYDRNSKCLFVGDTFGGNEEGTVRNFFKLDSRNDNQQMTIDSCKRLLAYDFELALPFHYELILKDAKFQLEKLINGNT